MPPADREWWNDTLVVRPIAELGKLAGHLLLLTSVGWVALILREAGGWRSLPVLAFLATATALLFVPLLAAHGARHVGHVYLVVLLAVWLGQSAGSSAPTRRPSALAILVGVQALSGLAAAFFGVWRPMSEADDVARLTRDGFVMAHNDVALTSVAGHLGRPVFRLADNTLATYAIFGLATDQTDDIELARRARDAATRARSDGQDAYLVWSLDRPLPNTFADDPYEIIAKLDEAAEPMERFLVLRWTGPGSPADAGQAFETEASQRPEP